MAGSISFPAYFILSSSLTAVAVSYAFQTRVQFYPAIIYLVTSKLSMLVLGNMGLVLTLLLGRITKTLFFGQLRDVEVELLYENARYAVTETCLALTIFREELTTRVMTLFTALLFSKSFHWLCQSRVEYVESDNVSRWTHLRLLTLMGSLLVVDVAFVAGCVYFWNGPSVLILFGFEYTILAVSVLSTLVRYCLHIIDMNIEGNWPQKGSYLFFLEFITEVVRFLSYVVFFTIIFTYYGMPLHIVRDLWMSYVNLKRRLIIFNKYRKLTANMQERFPDATAEELAACEGTCIICRDAMEVGNGKKLPCGHIFHLDCLRLWLQQQQSCPTCRAEIPTTENNNNNAAAAGAAAAAPGLGAPGGGGAVPAGGAGAGAGAAAVPAVGVRGQAGHGAGQQQRRGVWPPPLQQQLRGGTGEARGGGGGAGAIGAGAPAPTRGVGVGAGVGGMPFPQPIGGGGGYPGAAAAAAAGGGGFPPHFPHPPTQNNNNPGIGTGFPPSFPRPASSTDGGAHAHAHARTHTHTQMPGGAYPPPPFGYNGFMPPPSFGFHPQAQAHAHTHTNTHTTCLVANPEGVNVYEEPDAQSEVLETVPLGTVLSISPTRVASAQNDPWIRLTQGGYIKEKKQPGNMPNVVISPATHTHTHMPHPSSFGLPFGMPPPFMMPQAHTHTHTPPPPPPLSFEDWLATTGGAAAGLAAGNHNNTSTHTHTQTHINGRLSRALISMRLDLSEAKTGLEAVMNTHTHTQTLHAVEIQRVAGVINRLERAYEALVEESENEGLAEVDAALVEALVGGGRGGAGGGGGITRTQTRTSGGGGGGDERKEEKEQQEQGGGEGKEEHRGVTL